MSFFKTKEPDSDEILLAKFMHWMLQLKNTWKIYAFCLAGGAFSPFAWFALFYIAAFHIRKNPYAKNYMTLPLVIIGLETAVQAALLWASIIIAQTSVGSSSSLQFMYICTASSFIVFTLLCYKFHSRRIRKIQQGILNRVNNTNVNTDETIFDRGSEKAKEAFNLIKNRLSKVGE